MNNEWTKKVEALQAENAALESELEVALGKIRELEWEIYRPLKEGEMTKPGDQALLPDEDAVWTVISGQNYREVPSPLYPAHCQYRRHIANELKHDLAEIKKDAESSSFYRMQIKKGFAGKESARQKKIEALEAENAALKRRLAPIEAVYERILHSDFPIRNDVQEMWAAIKEANA